MNAPAFHVPSGGSEERERERALLDRIARGDRAAVQALVMAHMPLAVRYAKRYGRRLGSGQLDDLVQEGVIGLLEAARRFDRDHDVRFATYAAWWVRHYMHRFVQRNSRAVASPDTRAMRRFGPCLGPLRREVEQRLGREATVEDLASFMGAQTSDVAPVAQYLSGRDCSYEAFEHEPRVPEPDAEEVCAQAERRAALRRAVGVCADELGERAERILRERYLGVEGRTLREVGEGIGLSRERVRQIEGRCFERLRRELAPVAANSPGL